MWNRKTNIFLLAHMKRNRISLFVLAHFSRTNRVSISPYVTSVQPPTKFAAVSKTQRLWKQIIPRTSLQPYERRLVSTMQNFNGDRMKIYKTARKLGLRKAYCQRTLGAQITSESNITGAAAPRSLSQATSRCPRTLSYNAWIADYRFSFLT